MHESNNLAAWKEMIEKGLKGETFDQLMNSLGPEGIRYQGLYYKDQEMLPDLRSWPDQIKYSRVGDAELELEQEVSLDEQEGMDSTVLMMGDQCDHFFEAKSCEYILENFDRKVFERALERKETLYVDVNGMNFGALKEDILFAKKNKAQFVVNGARLHNAGATIIQEFSYLLNFTQKLFEQGVSPQNIKFLTALDSQFFLSIAKMRSLRCLLEELYEAWGFEPMPFVMAMSSLREQTLYDPWSNLLRNNTSAMGAILGGANHVLIRSYDALFSLLTQEKATAKAARIARQNLNVLRYEAKLEQVADSAKGSFAVEALSLELVREGWASFLNWKDKGILENICDFSTAIGAVAKLRQEKIQTRRQVITGVNDFANPHETMLKLYGKPWLPVYLSKGLFPLRRNAEKYENLRLAVEKYLEENEGVLVAQIVVDSKNPKSFSGATFLQNLFEVIAARVERVAAKEENEALGESILVLVGTQERKRRYLYDPTVKSKSLETTHDGGIRFGSGADAYELLKDLLIKEGVLS